MAGGQKINNGSDNLLLDAFLDPIMGCTPMEAPDLTNAGVMGTSQALDEIMAAKDATAPIALVPENDEMVLVNDAAARPRPTCIDQQRRARRRQPRPTTRRPATANYCQNMVNVQTPFLAKNQTLLTGGPTPVPGTGNNLFTFMANRLNMSFTNLGCQNFGLTNPVTVTLDGNGAAIAATLNTTQQKATTTGAAAGGGNGTRPAPPAGGRKGRPHHRLMNPSGA